MLRKKPVYNSKSQLTFAIPIGDAASETAAILFFVFDVYTASNLKRPETTQRSLNRAEMSLATQLTTEEQQLRTEVLLTSKGGGQ